jgi:ATP-dependent Clp protease ATP-binding subunit ClpA
VEDPLSDALLSGTFQEGDTILVDVSEEEVVLKRSEEKPKEKSPEPVA